MFLIIIIAFISYFYIKKITLYKYIIIIIIIIIKKFFFVFTMYGKIKHISGLTVSISSKTTSGINPIFSLFFVPKTIGPPHMIAYIKE